jgi:hypothetical protein
MEMRDYIAISIKHSTKDCIMYWGKRTPDNEDRCFSGYTPSFFDCERSKHVEMRRDATM